MDDKHIITNSKYTVNTAYYNDIKIIDVSHSRLLVIMIVFCLTFIILAFKLFEVVLFNEQKSGNNQYSVSGIDRAEIIDRSGVLLAVNLSTKSLYANPKIIMDSKDTADKLHKVLPDLNHKQLLHDLSANNKNFVWIKRNLTPKEQYAVNNLGIPGLSFESGIKRVYPHKSLTCHTLGYVGVDGRGLSGIEKYFDLQLTPDNNNQAKEPLQLSLDIGVQNIVHEELSHAVEEFKAIGGAGIVMDATTGEVVAMVSLPDFDPHMPAEASDEQLFNRITLGLSEPGSTFKTFTMAMALDTDTITLHDVYDVNSPIKAAGFRIGDFHAKGGWLSVPEIFMYSSNIGTAHIVLDLGTEKQQELLKSFGLLSPLEIELPEKASPLYPSISRWSHISTMTISYGHGIAVTPMHMVKTYSSLVNGGILHPVTLKKVREDGPKKGVQIIQQSTSEEIRKLLRLVVEHGTGRKANVPGYLVGGKTGTADKAKAGRYAKHSNLSSFIAAFPMDNPKYVILVMLDEPKGNKSTGGYSTAGWTAAPAVGKIIGRMGPLFGIQPIDEENFAIKQKLWLDYKTGSDAQESL